jgi:ketosteroid isomerase-like protein
MSENEVLGLEDRRFAAMTGKDWKTLDGLLHEQLLYTHSNGVTDTKAVWMDAMRSGRTVYKSAKQGERKVRLYGDSALVTGKAQIEAEVNGQARSLKLCYLNVWTKTPQGWKFVAWQSTPQPAA